MDRSKPTKRQLALRAALFTLKWGLIIGFCATVVATVVIISMIIAAFKMDALAYRTSQNR